MYAEAVEVCPDCMGEDIYENWDVKEKGYIVNCKHCDHKIFLCDECMHTDDNPTGYCDWVETQTGGKCFRGEI